MAGKKHKTTLEMFENGSILTVYGSKNLVSVSPAFAIDRVKVSIVELGTGGKNYTDVFLTCEEMRLFCEEIDRGIAFKKISEDTGDFPSAYEWRKGKNGSKCLKIGGGKKGVRVQTHDKKMTVVQYSDLRTLSFNYKLISGLIMVNNGYYKTLVDAFYSKQEEREKRIAKNYNPAENDEVESCQEEPQSSKIKDITIPVEPVEPRREPNPLAKQILERAKEDTTTGEKKKVEPEVGRFYIKSPLEPITNKANVTSYEGFVFRAGSDKLEKMVFYANQFKNADQLKRLVATASLNTENSKGVLIECRYSKAQSLIFRGFVVKEQKESA